MSKPACVSVERYQPHAHERSDMACCRAVRVYMDVPQHEGPCCADADCTECDPVLLTERVKSDRAILLTALYAMVLSYDLTQREICPMGDHAKGVVRGFFFGVREGAGSALDQAEGR